MVKTIPRALILLAIGCWAAWAAADGPAFEITFPASAHAQPITGRVFVVLAKDGQRAPLSQIGNWQSRTPFFAVDIDQLRPGQPAVLDSTSLGYPYKSLKDMPPGDYYAQALINVYTQFHRSDGHVIWAHMDQWEGQAFNRSPGNLTSDVSRIHFDANSRVSIDVAKVIPPIQMPADTKYVKHIKILSKLLTAFWGHPFYLGATVLLPKGYDEHPADRYPVIYIQGHFGLRSPYGFTETPQGPAGDTSRQWLSDEFPRIIAVTFQHPTPYFDDSYAVNSANNGPYGDALLQELIPHLEEHFRMIREPYARVLTGGSTGGWESLALQVHHPDFFGGTWTFYPDPIDFRRYQLSNIYDDDNAFYPPGFDYPLPERPLMRTAEGQVTVTMRQMCQFEATLGSKGRSAQQIEAWEAVYGPVGEDGYPLPLWDKMTGKIDRAVALYMREHGYDLSYYVRTNWPRLGPQWKGKFHLYVGDMDNFYLNLAVYLFEDFMKTTDGNATFEYGRPMKGHGWQPMTNADLIKMMAAEIQKNAPR